MNILFNIVHPSDVHLYKNVINMLRLDNNIYVVSRDSEIINKLLSAYRINSFSIPYEPDKTLQLLKECLARFNTFSSITKKANLDFIIGPEDPFAFFCANLFSKSTVKINLADNRPNINPLIPMQYAITPFIDHIITFDTIRKYEGYDFGPKKIEVTSYKELAYLHPDVFTPDEKVLTKYDLKRGKEYVILRFVGWKAYHDILRSGFNDYEKEKLVNTLKEFVDVYISSEKKLPQSLVRHELKISPEDIHSVLFFSKFLVSDSQTMTTEAGVLGTPALRYNSFVGDKDMGNFIELERKYRLIYNLNNFDDVLIKANEFLEDSNLKNEWAIKRDEMLKDKINFTLFLYNFIKNYKTP